MDCLVREMENTQLSQWQVEEGYRSILHGKHLGTQRHRTRKFLPKTKAGTGTKTRTLLTRMLAGKST